MVRVISYLTYFALATQATSAASIPESNDALDVLQRDTAYAPQSSAIVSPDHTLERRKGGGGRGGGSSSGGSRSSGGSSSGGSSRTSGSSMVGGSTRAGSGTPRSFGRGGGYYGGGAVTPYQAGRRTPKGLVAGPLLAVSAVLLIMPGLWLYNTYPYYYNNPYRFYNRSAVNEDQNTNNVRGLVLRQAPTGRNETLPVLCLCQEFSVCGCDENTDQSYIDDLIGNGSYAALNKSLVTVSTVNGTKTLVLNGSLPNGTTAPGGVDDAAASLTLGKYSGYWAMGLIVLYGVFM